MVLGSGGREHSIAWSLKKDTNILSLCLAIKNSISPFYLFEADCIFENKCFDLIFHPKFKDKSVWYSKGLLNIEQYLSKI